MAVSAKNLMQSIKGVQINPKIHDLIVEARAIAGMHHQPEIGIMHLLHASRKHTDSRNVLFKQAARIAKEYNIDIDAMTAQRSGYELKYFRTDSGFPFIARIWRPKKLKRQMEKLRRLEE